MADLLTATLLPRRPLLSRSGPDADALTDERFAALYRESAADLFAYVASLLGDRSAAEDVTALAFESAYRARERHDPRRGSPRAWLFGIARNAALDELRSRRRRAAAANDPSALPLALVEPEADAVVRRTTVRGALASLTPREREVVLLKFHGQLSSRELATVLGVSETNAATRLHRALQKLRRACGEEVGP